jgi:hypothetical protein
MPENPETVPIMYSNVVRFFYNIFDFSMVFGISEPSLNPPEEDGKATLTISAYNRVIMSPPHFKKFVRVATSLLEKYEKEHGPIPDKKEG